MPYAKSKREKLTITVSRQGYARLLQAIEVRNNTGPGTHTMSSVVDGLLFLLPKVKSARNGQK